MPGGAVDTTREFRNAMGRFATGITVVSTQVDGKVHGMTANGFMSVSLSPRLVLVSIREEARIRGLLERSGTYGVSVLSRGHRLVSDHFAGRRGAPPPDGFVELEGVPVVADALTHLAARIVAIHPAGDHLLYLGEVLDFAERQGEPLIFHGGRYRELGAETDARVIWHELSNTWF
ncbi:flavin reductase family protein [Streptomyces spongiae]|uniref:Flavin reductase family protein n=1 Tax=Streptomyces spongiae TaxID=565072 RepID=A0A5N8XAH4_9ACTN|nr:flavin reductase family protein [Streptomyces spongiae]MPY56184.1 flavin reductase family protein [Streptomyces spongiae]